MRQPRLAPVACGLSLLVAMPALAQSAGGTAGAAAPAAPASVLTYDAEGHVVVHATRITQPIRVDGRLDDAAYREVPPAKLEPFGESEGIPFGRIDWHARLGRTGEQQVSPAIALQQGERSALSASSASRPGEGNKD